MSATLDALSSAARLANVILTTLTGVYLLYRHSQSGLRQSLYWGLGLVLYGIAFVFPFGFGIGLIGRALPAFFLEQTFLAFAIVLFYYACAIVVTNKRMYSAFLPWTILVLQEVVIAYFVLVLGEVQIALLLQVVLFGVPVSTFVAVFFSLDYLSLRRGASLLIASAFWFQLVLGAIFLIVDRTPLDWIYYVANSADSVVYFAGFVLLARSKSQEEK
jgi:hypothetical protein